MTRTNIKPAHWLWWTFFMGSLLYGMDFQTTFHAMPIKYNLHIIFSALGILMLVVSTGFLMRDVHNRADAIRLILRCNPLFLLGMALGMVSSNWLSLTYRLVSFIP